MAAGADGSGEPAHPPARARVRGRVPVEASATGARVAIALALSFGLHLIAIVALTPGQRVPVIFQATAPAVAPPLAIRLRHNAPARSTQPTPTMPGRARVHSAQRASPGTPPVERPAPRAASPAPSTASADADRRRADAPDPAQAGAAPANTPPAATARPPAATSDVPSPATSAPIGGAASTGNPAVDAGGGFTAGLARRQAGRVDRQLRGGKSGVPKEADTPWARFVRGVDDAHVDTSTTGGLDSYTSPDGVVIYRLTVGKRVTCRMTGGLGRAGPVNCPAGVSWHRED